ncbi:T9SS type A sorting domain-containing protein [bacterium]|nr:T9SS type A sorting domain-containing protein [bacterium]
MIQKTSDKQKVLGIIFFVFCFLLVGVGVTFGDDTVTFTTMSLSNKNLLPGTTDQVVLHLKAVNNSTTFNDSALNKIQVTSIGTPVNIRDVDRIYLWRDNNTIPQDSIGELQVSSQTISGNPSIVIFDPTPVNTVIPANSTRYFYITYDLKTNVTDIDTIDFQVNSEDNITLVGTNCTVDPTTIFPLNSSGVDTIIVTATDYTVDTIPDQIAGKPFGVKIQMVDGDGNLDLDYTGSTISITGALGFAPTSAPDGTNPSYPPPESWQGLSDRGEKILTVVLYKKETGRILEVTDSLFFSKDSNSFDIDAGIKFNLSLPQNMPVKKSADIRIDVYEPYQNEFIYTGTAQFTSTDSQAILPENYTFSAGELSKLFTNGISFGTVDNHTVILTDTINYNVNGTQTVIVQSENEGYRSINYPNPFDPHQGTTTIQFYMNGEGKAKIKIYTLTGNLVREWDVEAQAGINSAFQWDGRDKDGNMVANGTYLCLVKTDNKKETIKISIIK